LDKKRPRTRHRFNFSGQSEKAREDNAITSERILKSLNSQSQHDGSTLEDGNTREDFDQTTDPVKTEASSRSPPRSRLRILPIIVFGAVVLLGFSGLVPTLVSVDTLGKVEYVVSRIPFIYMLTIAVFWLSALVVGLLVRRTRRT
jgi:hypothetical protein